MGKPQGRKGNTAKNKAIHRLRKAKHFSKHHDQIYEDLQPENVGKFTQQARDESLPGLGQFYCVHCAKYFVNRESLFEHKKTKNHKRMLKTLK